MRAGRTGGESIEDLNSHSSDVAAVLASVSIFDNDVVQRLDKSQLMEERLTTVL